MWNDGHMQLLQLNIFVPEKLFEITVNIKRIFRMRDDIT